MGDRFRTSAKTLDSGDYQILKLAVMVEKQTVGECLSPRDKGRDRAPPAQKRGATSIAEGSARMVPDLGEGEAAWALSLEDLKGTGDVYAHGFSEATLMADS